MANQGAKKIVEKNKQRMELLWRIILGSNIPTFGGYKIFGLLRGTFFSGGSEGEVEDEKSRKKREKMEKKASRGKMVKTRTR